MKFLYNMGSRLLSGLLVAVVAVSTASAQIGQPQRQTPQPGSVPVADKVFGWYEHQRIFVQVEIVNANMLPDEYDAAAGMTYRHGERFGNFVGNLIPVRFRIYVVKPKDGEREIEVQLAALKSNPPRLTILPVENPDWVFASREALEKGEAPLVVREFANASLDWGGKVYECSRMIQVYGTVQTFKDPRYRMNLWLEFTYASTVLPGGGLDWKVLETPDYWVDLSRRADPGDDLSLGNTNPLNQPRPVALALFLIGGGLFIGFSVVAFYATRFLRNKFGKRGLDDQERLWSTLKPILERTKTPVPGAKEAYALKRADVTAILAAVHAFINATEEGKVSVSAWTLEEVRQRKLEIKDGDRWFHVIEPLRGILMEQGEEAALQPDRYGRIVGMIREICPQP